MDGMSIGLKGNWAIRVPFHQQRPIVWVIPPQKPQLINTLIMAEPAAIPAGGFIGGGQHIRILAVKSAQILVYAKLHQWSTLSCIQLTEPLRLISGNAQVFHKISVFARCDPALRKKGGFDLVDFEFPAPWGDLCREPIGS